MEDSRRIEELEEQLEELEEQLEELENSWHTSLAFHDIVTRAYSVDPQRTENDLIALGLCPHAYRAVS